MLIWVGEAMSGFLIILHRKEQYFEIEIIGSIKEKKKDAKNQFTQTHYTLHHTN